MHSCPGSLSWGTDHRSLEESAYAVGNEITWFLELAEPPESQRDVPRALSHLRRPGLGSPCRALALLESAAAVPLGLLPGTVPGAGRAICASHLALRYTRAYPQQRHAAVGAASPPTEVTTPLGLGAQVLFPTLPRNMLSQGVQSLNVG